MPSIQLEYSRSNESRERASKHVASVQNRHTSCHLLLRIEHADHVQRSGIELVKVSLCLERFNRGQRTGASVIPRMNRQTSMP